MSKETVEITKCDCCQNVITKGHIALLDGIGGDWCIKCFLKSFPRDEELAIVFLSKPE